VGGQNYLPKIRQTLTAREARLAQKARIQNRDALAEALSTAYSRLKDHVKGEGQDLDQEITTSKLPDHLQFLVCLATFYYPFFF
jgi:hypothetical protein